MLNDASGFKHVYVACGYTDLRKGIDSLAAIVMNNFELDPFEEGNIFLFCGRRTDRIKALTYEGDGFLLMTKRLVEGNYQWPRDAQEARELSAREFRWLMEGLSTKQKKVISQVKLGVI